MALIRVRDPGFEASASIPDWDDVYGPPWTKRITSGFSTATVSTANPRSGTNHLRFAYTSAAGGDNLQLYVTGNDPGVALDRQGTTFPNTSSVTPGEEIDVSCYVSVVAGASSSHARFTARWWTSGGAEADSLDNSPFTDITQDNQGDGYLLLDHTFTVPTNTAYMTLVLHINVNGAQGDVTYDADDFASTVSGVLYVSNAGFRFPYSRWT